MNETIINGIDVSEYFIEVVDEGGSTIDYKIFPNSDRLLVEKIFEQNQQLAHLQEENNILKQAIKNKNFVAIVKENEELKADLKGETEQAQKWYQLETDKHFQMLKYEQALKEIRKEANRLLFVENPIYGYNNSNYFEILAKYVLAKTDEVLEDNEDVENN